MQKPKIITAKEIQKNMAVFMYYLLTYKNIMMATAMLFYLWSNLQS